MQEVESPDSVSGRGDARAREYVRTQAGLRESEFTRLFSRVCGIAFGRRVSWLPGTADGGAGAEIRAGAGRAEALLWGANQGPPGGSTASGPGGGAGQPGRGLLIPSGRDGRAVFARTASLARGGLGCPDRLLRESSDLRKFEAKLHQPQSLPWQVVGGAATSVSTR